MILYAFVLRFGLLCCAAAVAGPPLGAVTPQCSIRLDNVHIVYV